MRIRLFTIALAMQLTIPVLPSHAADSASGRQGDFISELVSNALLSVTSDAISPAERQHRLEGYLLKDFDIPLIARFVLGRFWHKATTPEQQAFTAAYSDFMVHVYTERFTRFSGESFRVIAQSAESPNSTVVYTEMTQPAKGQPLKVEWHVIDNNGYRITDISVAGVSMALAQREDFVSFLQKNGGDLASLIRQIQIMTTSPEIR
jgi:phospholipid transport system substrate-binding protein